MTTKIAVLSLAIGAAFAAVAAGPAPGGATRREGVGRIPQAQAVQESLDQPYFEGRPDGTFLVPTPGPAIGLTQQDVVAGGIRLRFSQAGAGGCQPLEQLPGVVNIIRPDSTLYGLRRFARVRCSQASPGADIEFHFTNGPLELDWILAPGASISQARLTLDAGVRARLEPSGDLVLKRGQDSLRLRKPALFQGAHSVAGGYRIRGRVVSFWAAAHNDSQPLVIDPVIDFATYIGGSCCNNDWVNAVATDTEGNIYLTGHAGSEDFPTMNPQKSSCALGSLGSCNDAFIAKLDPSGQRLIYSTYYGGSDGDEGLAIAADKQGRAVVAGYCAGNKTFILIVDQDGRRVGERIVSGSSTTPLNGTFPAAVALDPDGNILVAGETYSDLMPLVRPVQAQAGAPSCGGTKSIPFKYVVDAWVGRFSGDYLIPDFLTFLGGGGNDRATAIAADAAGNIYVAGETSSRDFPLVNAYQDQNRSTLEGNASSCSATELFLTKIDPAVPRIVYSTYFGGSSLDLGARLAVDPAGYAYLGGYSSSTDWTPPGLAGNAGPYFMIKVAPDGQPRYAKWMGSLGGGSGVPPAGVALEPTGQAWMALNTIEGIQPGGISQAAWSGPGAQIRSIAAGAGGTLIAGGRASYGQIQPVRAFQPSMRGSSTLSGFVARYSPGPQADCQRAYAVNGASYRGPEASPSSIVSLFGCEFTDTTEAAPSPQLPETLAGVRVLLLQENRDPVAARLYIVTPNQINFVVPDELGPGTYSIEVRRGDTLVATGVVSLETVAPALFTAGASGVGAPAAWALNIAADGKQTLLPVVDCGSGACEPGWIDVGAAGERVFLLLFGTGLRGRTSTDGVVATIGNRKIPVMAAVAQSEYAGLDQVNVELPPDLAGAGLVDLLITADGVQSNRVKLRIR